MSIITLLTPWTQTVFTEAHLARLASMGRLVDARFQQLGG